MVAVLDFFRVCGYVDSRKEVESASRDERLASEGLEMMLDGVEGIHTAQSDCLNQVCATISKGKNFRGGRWRGRFCRAPSVTPIVLR
jgi:hypothetical protein